MSIPVKYIPTNQYDQYVELIADKAHIPIGTTTYSDYIVMIYYPLFNDILNKVDKLISKSEEDNKTIKKLEEDIKIIKKLIIDEHDRNQAVRGINALSKELNKEGNDENDEKSNEKNDNYLFNRINKKIIIFLFLI
jgi:hypothetical protein